MTVSSTEEYCQLMTRMKTVLGDRRYAVLKLYHGYGKRKASYGPRDIDIFIGSDTQAVYDILKGLRKVFPGREIKVVERKTFLNPVVSLSISGYSIVIDLYTEVVISPALTLSSVPETTAPQLVPWCADAVELAFEPPLDILYTVAHAIKHGNMREIEILSLVERFNELSAADVKKLIYGVEKAGIEETTLLVLELVVLYAKHCLNLEASKYAHFYRSIHHTMKFIRESLHRPRGTLIYMLARILLLANTRSCLRGMDLKPVLALYVLESLKSVLSVRNKGSLSQLLKIVLTHTYKSVYELLYRTYRIVVRSDA